MEEIKVSKDSRTTTKIPQSVRKKIIKPELLLQKILKKIVYQNIMKNQIG